LLLAGEAFHQCRERRRRHSAFPQKLKRKIIGLSLELARVPGLRRHRHRRQPGQGDAE